MLEIVYSSTIPEEFQIDFDALAKSEQEFKDLRPINAEFVADTYVIFNENFHLFNGIETMFDVVKNEKGEPITTTVKYPNGKTVLIKKYEILTIEKEIPPVRHYNQPTKSNRIFHCLSYSEEFLTSRLPINITIFQDEETSEILHIAGIADNRNPTTSFDLFVFLFFGNDHVSEYNAAFHYYNSLTNPDGTKPVGNSPSVYGRASWMSFNDALDLNLFGRNDIYLGIMENSKGLLYAIRYVNDKHLITIAPSGTGKNRCVQIPNLLLNQNSIIAVDPKGENAAVTAKRRRDDGHNVLILNPFGVLKSHFEKEGFRSEETSEFISACFNPLERLDSENENFVADVYALCDALIEQNEREPFWSNSARELLSGLIMHVCSSKELKEANKRNLVHVRKLLTDDVEKFKNNIEAIISSSDDTLPIAQKLNRFKTLHDEDKLNLGIISTAVTETQFLDDPSLAKNLLSNNIDFQKFRTEKTTLYIILPAKYLTIYAKWFKLIVTSALNEFTESHEGEKVLFMLDECSLLGRLNALETAISYARGFGIQIWSFWQDLHQLYDIYGKRAESFLANAGVQQYFTPNDITTCDKISERLGERTDYATTHTDNYHNGNSKSQSEIKVPLMTVPDLLGLKKEKQVIFFSGSKNAILAEKRSYDACDYFGNYSPNPYDRKSLVSLKTPVA